MSLVNPYAIGAVFRRQLASFLANPLGYIFIFAFVVVAAILVFWPDDFYKRNLSDFAGLYQWMPVLLMVLVPALGMGAWASEREQGTEELLLTLPVSIVDAVLGKYLAILAFYTIALAANVSHLCFLAWLGSPDWGLMIANFAGWWLIGASFSALALAASVLVPHAAIAFVVGALLCAGAGGIAWASVDWINDFNRGVISLGGVISALAVAASGLALAIILLAGKTWEAVSGERIATQVANVVFAVALALGVSAIGYRHAAGVDASSDGLSSLSADSRGLLGSLEQTVQVEAVISRDLPDDLKKKRQEVLDKLTALKRAAGDRVRVTVLEPGDALDEIATRARDQLGLNPREVLVDSMVGRQPREVFLGAVVRCAGQVQKIDYFDPGLSVEYELVRAVRTAARQVDGKKPVLGILKTGTEMNGGFDMQTFNSNPAWQVVEELRRQYEVREVELREPIPSEISVLLAACPSEVEADQIKHLHDYIWAGRPCLMLVDTVPAFNPGLAPSQKRQPPRQQGMFGQPQGPTTPKADIKPILDALGVDYDLAEVGWSQSLKGYQFQGMPPTFIWSSSRRGAEGHLNRQHPITQGMEAVLTILPGVFYGSGKQGMQVTPLVRLPSDQVWGEDRVENFIRSDFFGRVQVAPGAGRWQPALGRKSPLLAAHITGRMAHAYGSETPEPAEAEPEPRPDAQDKPETPVAEIKPAAPAGPKKGDLGEKPVNVILVSDVDLMHDQFYAFYRNTGGRFSADELKSLTTLNNIQLILNAVDFLAGDQALLTLRNRRPAFRTLDRMEEVLQATEDKAMRAEEQAEASAKAQIDAAKASFDEKVAAIDKRTDIDERAKEELKAEVQAREQRKLDIETQKIETTKKYAVRTAKTEQEREIGRQREFVRWLSVGLPALLLALLVVVVFALRLVREHTDIPAARRRQ